MTDTTPGKDATEIRLTSDTGGQKGSKLARFDLIPTGPLRELAEHYGKGALKYEPVNGLDNWRNGYPWGLSYAAMQRHLTAFWSGEDIDEETGSKHLAAVTWHCMTLMEFMERPDLARFDDRQDKITAAIAAEFLAADEQFRAAAAAAVSDQDDSSHTGAPDDAQEQPQAA